MAVPTNIKVIKVSNEDLDRYIEELQDWKTPESKYFYYSQPQQNAELQKLKKFVQDEESRQRNSIFDNRYRSYEQEMRDEIMNLREELYRIRGVWDHEEHLRNKHPGLQEAWEKYQTMLRLVDER
jgi:hypothetical protein